VILIFHKIQLCLRLIVHNNCPFINVASLKEKFLQEKLYRKRQQRAGEERKKRESKMKKEVENCVSNVNLTLK
jgi:hypothetical protein